MAVKLRLMRMGKKKQPVYRVVAADSRSPRDGRFIEILGTYEPRAEPSRVVLMLESATVEAAREALDTLPFARLHLIDFDLIPLAPFVGLARLFQTAS